MRFLVEEIIIVAISYNYNQGYRPSARSNVRARAIRLSTNLSRLTEEKGRTKPNGDKFSYFKQ